MSAGVGQVSFTANLTSGNEAGGQRVTMDGITRGNPVLLLNTVVDGRGLALPVVSVGDEAPNAYKWSRLESDSIGGLSVEAWIGVGGSGTSFGVTAEVAGASYPYTNIWALALELTGAATAPIESSSVTTGSGSTTVDATPEADGDLVLACFGCGGGIGGSQPAPPWQLQIPVGHFEVPFLDVTAEAIWSQQGTEGDAISATLGSSGIGIGVVIASAVWPPFASVI